MADASEEAQDLEETPEAPCATGDDGIVEAQQSGRQKTQRRRPQGAEDAGLSTPPGGPAALIYVCQAQEDYTSFSDPDATLSREARTPGRGCSSSEAQEAEETSENLLKCGCCWQHPTSPACH